MSSYISEARRYSQTECDRLQWLRGDMGEPQPLQTGFVNGIKVWPAVLSSYLCDGALCTVYF